MQPHILIDRLASLFNSPDQILLLILNFLTDRAQWVSVNEQTCHTIVTNRAVFCPRYFLSCILIAAGHPSQTVSLSNSRMIQHYLHGSQSDHGCALPTFIQWCEDNYLDLNASKTKELITDFRRNRPEPRGSTIQSQEVQIVASYKYLGAVLDSQLYLL